MPFTGTLDFSAYGQEKDHPNGHFLLISDDGKHFVGGIAQRGGTPFSPTSQILIGCVEDLDPDTFQIDQAKWQADFATWRSDNGVVEGLGTTFYMGHAAIPVAGTPFFYIGGFQKAGFSDSTLDSGEAYACWLRYRIIDSSNLVVDGGAMYKSGPSPPLEAVPWTNWCWGGALLNDKIYGVCWLSTGIAIGNMDGTYLVELPASGNEVALFDNFWKLRVTRFAENTGFSSAFFDAVSNGNNNGLSLAIYRADATLLGPGRKIGILSYNVMDNEQETPNIGVPGSYYWEIDPALNSVVVDQRDMHETLGQPWSDAGKLYDGTDAGSQQSENDYGAPCVSYLPNGTIELLFGRGFTDDNTKARWRRWIYNPRTGVYRFNKIYDATIGGVTIGNVDTALLHRDESGELIAALVSDNWQQWTFGALEIPTPDVCVPISGFTDEDVEVAEEPCDWEWPFDDLRPQAIGIYPVQATLGGGPNLAGNEQTEESGAGFWRISYGGVAIRTSDQVRKWREGQTILNGRSGICCVHLYDGKRAPWPNIGDINAEADGSMAVGDTGGDIVVINGAALQPGMHFSAEERAYRLVTVEEPIGDPPSYPVTFWPKLRKAIADGDQLEFAHPICRMRLAKDDGMSTKLDLMRFATPSIDWVEDI